MIETKHNLAQNFRILNNLFVQTEKPEQNNDIMMSLWFLSIVHKEQMSSLVFSAFLICFLIPIHGITQHVIMDPRTLSATDVSTPADPAPSLPPQTHCMHTWHWRIVPQNKGVGGFCGEQATKHSCYNGESGGQVQLGHAFKPCSMHRSLKTNEGI